MGEGNGGFLLKFELLEQSAGRFSDGLNSQSRPFSNQSISNLLVN